MVVCCNLLITDKIKHALNIELGGNKSGGRAHIVIREHVGLTRLIIPTTTRIFLGGQSGWLSRDALLVIVRSIVTRL